MLEVTPAPHYCGDRIFNLSLHTDKRWPSPAHETRSMVGPVLKVFFNLIDLGIYNPLITFVCTLLFRPRQTVLGNIRIRSRNSVRHDSSAGKTFGDLLLATGDAPVAVGFLPDLLIIKVQRNIDGSRHIMQAVDPA